MTAAAVRQQALARAQAGDDAAAIALFADGLRRFPDDAAFANSAGSYHSGKGRAAEALALFDRALRIAPGLHEAAVNRAVVLQKLGRPAEAATYLTGRERELAGVPRYWTMRASAERGAGDLSAAIASYDAALRRDAGNAKALAGRAQLALDRGATDAARWYERALTQTPGDPHLLLGFGQALHAGGATGDALYVSEALATQHPDWPPGLELYAELRREAGDSAFADHYRNATTPAAYHSWGALLSGAGRHAEAADVLAAAHARFPAERSFALAEAVAAGEAGDTARAAALFAAFRQPTGDWQVAEARLHLLRGAPDAAEALLAAALQRSPDDVAAWSLRDLTWRITGDPRHDWLHGQPGLVQVLALDLDATELAEGRRLLDGLHDRSVTPFGQSVRHGSQTRGALFDRAEPAIARVAAAIREAIERYRAALPPRDPDHPLLRHRDADWRIAGSWSIRLDGAGRHAAHIHPNGIVSSAAYLTVPPQVDAADRPGWLELGRPPRGLAAGLDAITTVRPRAGEVALFPSTLFHATRPITAGRRMTVAFDVGVAATR